MKTSIDFCSSVSPLGLLPQEDPKPLETNLLASMSEWLLLSLEIGAMVLFDVKEEGLMVVVEEGLLVVVVVEGLLVGGHKGFEIWALGRICR